MVSIFNALFPDHVVPSDYSIEAFTSALHEGWRPSKFAANTHEVVTRTKREEALTQPLGSKLGTLNFGPNPILVPWVKLDFVSSAFKHNLHLIRI